MLPPAAPEPANTQPAPTAPPPTAPHRRTATDRAAHRAAPPPAAPNGPAGRGRRSLTRQGRRPHLSVVIGLDTLAGLDDLPALLAGYGAIPAGTARNIAASAATITTLTADPTTGAATAAGALTYRPRQELRDQITTLLSTCQFPSCRQPSWRCDIDHTNAFNHQHPDRGGPTTTANTAPLCRRHHLFKHHTGWHVRMNPADFTTTWASPTGHTYNKTQQPIHTPQLWITTPGTAIAQHLDNRNATTTVTRTTRTPTTTRTTATAPAAATTTTTTGETLESATATETPGHHDTTPGWIEGLLTDLLLHHHLTKAPLEYQPDPDAWNTDIPSLHHADDTAPRSGSPDSGLETRQQRRQQRRGQRRGRTTLLTTHPARADNERARCERPPNGGRRTGLCSFPSASPAARFSTC